MTSPARRNYEYQREKQFRNINDEDTLADYNAKIFEAQHMIELLEQATDAQLEVYMVWYYQFT